MFVQHCRALAEQNRSVKNPSYWGQNSFPSFGHQPFLCNTIPQTQEHTTRRPMQNSEGEREKVVFFRAVPVFPLHAPDVCTAFNSQPRANNIFSSSHSLQKQTFQWQTGHVYSSNFSASWKSQIEVLQTGWTFLMKSYDCIMKQNGNKPLREEWVFYISCWDPLRNIEWQLCLSCRPHAILLKIHKKLKQVPFARDNIFSSCCQFDPLYGARATHCRWNT